MILRRLASSVAMVLALAGAGQAESMADALVSQLLAPPTQSLRDAAEEDDWETIHTALELFDPDFGPEPPAFVQDMAVEDIPEGMRDDIPAAVLEQLAED